MYRFFDTTLYTGTHSWSESLRLYVNNFRMMQGQLHTGRQSILLKVFNELTSGTPDIGWRDNESMWSVVLLQRVTRWPKNDRRNALDTSTYSMLTYMYAGAIEREQTTNQREEYIVERSTGLLPKPDPYKVYRHSNTRSTRGSWIDPH